MQPYFLRIEEVLRIHEDQIEQYGGSPGLRDPGLLASAVDSRVCPTTITPSLSTTMGWRNPYSRMDLATASTAPSLRRGLVSYGRTAPTARISINMSFPRAPPEGVLKVSGKVSGEA
jgi:hypothetical protein